MRDDNPVLIFEHKLLYGSKGARTEPGAVDATSEIPDDDYTVPLDRAAVRRPGTDVTILAWLLMAHFAAQAADELAAEGIDAEVIDVRSLSPIDYETIGESVRKTGRVVIVEEGPKTGGVSAEIAAGIMERFGESLVAPVVRVASADVPVPFARFWKTHTGPIERGSRPRYGRSCWPDGSRVPARLCVIVQFHANSCRCLHSRRLSDSGEVALNRRRARRILVKWSRILTIAAGQSARAEARAHLETQSDHVPEPRRACGSTYEIRHGPCVLAEPARLSFPLRRSRPPPTPPRWRG